jgi:hypothetical protein
MARKSSSGPGDSSSAARHVADPSSGAKKHTRRRHCPVRKRKTSGKFAITQGHIEARDTLRQQLGGYAAMLAPPEPSSRIKGQNNLIGLAVGIKLVKGKPTNDLAIKVFVRKKVANSRISGDAMVKPTLNGFPTDVVEAHLPRPFSTGSVVPCGSFIINNAIRQRTGRFEGGTLGCLVVTQDGTNCILTCNHVVANLNQATVNDAITSSNGTIANLLKWGMLVEPPGVNTCDCALGAILPNSVSQSLLGLALSTPASEVLVNDRVRKSGADSTVTTGTVVDKFYQSPFQYSLPGIDVSNSIFIQRNYIFENQIRIQSDPGTEFVEDGDSGSVVLLQDTGQPVGLLFAGDQDGFAFANPIAAVIDTLGLSQILTLSAS